MEEQLNIETIIKFIKHEKIYWTNHSLNRLHQRNILVTDVKEAIMNGRIIEYYYEDYPYPSCLILGYNKSNRIIHTVCGISDELIYIITAYYPEETEWEKDMETRLIL